MLVSIDYYSDWMKDQVIMLFCNQYNESKEQFSKFFEQFYEHEFQKNKAIKIVALEGNKVVGFQSFFYWPYQQGEMVFNSFQSGNSLVHPDYRGQGLFKKMLEFVYEKDEEIDFMVGFPVEASFNSFIRNGWTNLFNLQWYIKQVSFIAPLVSLISNPKKRLSLFLKTQSINVIQDNNQNEVRLINSVKFNDWRKSYAKDIKFYHSFSKEGQNIEFELKYNVRKKVIGELIIGKVVTDSNDKEFIQKGIENLIVKASKTRVVTIVSMALNPKNNNVVNQELKKCFKKIDKQIYFITKGKKKHTIQNWNLSRADIDTW